MDRSTPRWAESFTRCVLRPALIWSGLFVAVVVAGLQDDVYLRHQFQQANSTCLPLGGTIGALLGFVNESLRHQPDATDGGTSDATKNRTDPYQTI